jgi:hypothetical protein
MYKKKITNVPAVCRDIALHRKNYQVARRHREFAKVIKKEFGGQRPSTALQITENRDPTRPADDVDADTARALARIERGGSESGSESGSGGGSGGGGGRGRGNASDDDDDGDADSSGDASGADDADADTDTDADADDADADAGAGAGGKRGKPASTARERKREEKKRHPSAMMLAFKDAKRIKHEREVERKRYEEERETKRRAFEAKQQVRKEKSKDYAKRTRRGQPLMKFQIEDLLGKIQRRN